MRVLATMSGGVDSSVAAARLVDAGHEVVGVHLALSKAASAAGRTKGCCTLDDARDARRVSDHLGIPFYVWDLSDRFRSEVIDDFLDEYRLGRTPNPCIRCNERIKFAAVLDRALALDFDAVASGHYARIVNRDSVVELHRGIDPGKDQSYVLGTLEQEQLARILLPIGDAEKSVIREEALARGLLVARKPDSHDICFIPDGDTAGFVRRHVDSSPGPIVDATSGLQVGVHHGAHAFTIGQRRGLDLRSPAPDGAPRYVVDVDISTSTIMVGPAQMLEVSSIEADRVTWTSRPLTGSARLAVQMRAHGEPIEADIRVREDRLHIDLRDAIRGLAAGQTVVLYDGSQVVGAGIVARTHREPVG